MPQTSHSFTENPTFNQLFDQHIGAVFARQLLLADLLQVKEEPPIDLEKKCITFSNGQKYSIQLLGTQLETDGTFLWAWADENATPFPPELTKTALEMKALGAEKEIPAFSHPKVVLELSSVPLMPDLLNGDHLACLVAGLKNKAYWRDTQDHGVVYYLIQDELDAIQGAYTVPHILNTIEQVASYFATDNLVMVESFLNQQGFTGQWLEIEAQDGDEDEGSEEVEAASIFRAHRGSEDIMARFDEDGTLTEIEAHGFEGEEAYQNFSADEDGDMDGDNIDISDMLGQWGEAAEAATKTTPASIPDIYFDDEGEFPPKISHASNIKKPS